MAKLDDFKEFLDAEPELDGLGKTELLAYQAEVSSMLDRLDDIEPKNMNSEKYDDWAEVHEQLEDLMDEIIDRLDDMK